MPSLTDSQIEVISQKVKEQNPNSYSFSHELVDHVCCRIEQLMDEGESFENALQLSADLYEKKEISKIQRNFKTALHFSGYINSTIIYTSLLLYLLSWLFNWGFYNWLGQLAIVLVFVLIFRYILVFKKDRRLSARLPMLLLSSIGLVLLIIGFGLRFLWLNWGFGGTNSMPLMLFSWLIFSIVGLFYVYAAQKKKSSILIQGIIIVQLLLSLMGISTFIFPETLQFIPIYSQIIIAINILSFIVLFLIKEKGKVFIRLVIICSSFIVFLYASHRSVLHNKSLNVTYVVPAEEQNEQAKLYIYLDYNRYGKEMIPLKRLGASFLVSDTIVYNGGNLKFSYTILKDSLNLYDVFKNETYKTSKLHLQQSDTTFLLPHP